LKEVQVRIKERGAKQREERRLGLVAPRGRVLLRWERKRHLERREGDVNEYELI
jgi:hypothetical protein